MSRKSLIQIASELASLAAALAEHAVDAPASLTDATAPAAAPSKGKKGPPAATVPPPVEDTPAPEPTTDLVTDDQVEFVKDTAKSAKIDDIRSELLDYYVAQGNSKKQIGDTLANMDEPELRKEYGDYLARLIKTDEKGEMAFITSFDEPYIADRMWDGEIKKVWAKGGVTLNEKEVEDAKLEDPNAPPEEAKSAAPKRTVPARKK